MKQRLLPIVLFLSVVLNAHFLLRFCLVYNSPTFTNYESYQDFPIQNAGTLDPEGKLILKMVDGERGFPIKLDYYEPKDAPPPNYGFMIVNDDNRSDDSPSPDHMARYILGNRDEQSVLFTKRYDVFQKALRTIPVGSRIYECDQTCAAPFYYGLNPQFLEKVQKSVRSSGLRLYPGYATCLCRGH